MARTPLSGGGPGDGAEAPRGRTRWWLVAVLTVVPALVVLPLLVALAGMVLGEDDDRGEGGRASERVPCAEALAFGGAVLPAGARPTEGCTVQGFQDIHYSAAFRMPRTGVQDWLIHTYPDAPEPGAEFCAGEAADLCLDLSYAQGLPDGVEADAVQVRVVHEEAGTALVRFTAFTL
ncbi:hypothetical protein [Streptomyces parvulus]|uniref:hypothetical protein n=1 Tax=Streptomyces parvulus TaxID=146923 RepID=UPI0036F6811D